MMTWIKRLTRGLTVWMFALLLVGVIAGVVAPFVPLSWFPLLQVVPPLLWGLAVLVLIFLIVFLRQKRLNWAVLALVALAGVSWALSKDLRLRAPAEGTCELRVISYNVGSFGFEAERVEHVAHLLRRQHADVIALQEFRNHDMGDGINALSYLARTLEMPHYRFEHLPQHIHGAVIFSRHPIVQIDTMFMPEAEINTGIIAAIESPLGRIGIGNLHLSSYRINEFLDNDRDRWHQVDGLLRNSLTVLPLQQQKVDRVLAITARYPYPLVLTGDFNAVPHSRIMQQFFDRYTDSFLAVGSWIGWTYPIVGPLGLRIDYQFSTPALVPTQHRVLHADISDHQPVEVCYTLQP
jgi:endonuclease/exonuclease/phosphatase (EEP) superfamily protein YafD